MKNPQRNETQVVMIETTIGELICAISDAARESTESEAELQQLTEAVLSDILLRCSSDTRGSAKP